jgi:hypothetical protein
MSGKSSFTEAEVGNYDAHWSYVVWELWTSTGEHLYSVQIYPRDGELVEAGPVNPLFESIDAARASIPQLIEEAKTHA